MTASYTFRCEQWVPRPLEEVFTFFSDAANLGELTPTWLGFQILSPLPIYMAVGTRIKYRLNLHGLPLKWTTEIRRWDPPFRFVDVQLSGPYQLWHHTHRFEAHAGGTRIIDVVRYRIPLGIIGRIAHALKVRGDVERIFAYRVERVNELFTTPGA